MGGSEYCRPGYRSTDPREREHARSDHGVPEPINRSGRDAVAPVTDTVAIRITLARIRLERTVVLRVNNAVVIIITVASIAYSITIRVSLVWIRRERAVVLIVGHAIIVVITVTTIADAVVI